MTTGRTSTHAAAHCRGGGARPGRGGTGTVGGAAGPVLTRGPQQSKAPLPVPPAADAGTPVPDEPVSVPAMICHYAAYLRTWLGVTPETRVSGSQAELRLRFGRKVFAAVFGCRKKSWSLRGIEIRHGEQTATFTRGELDKAIATLLGQAPMAPAPQAPRASPRPQTDSTLRERRITVIRT